MKKPAKRTPSSFRAIAVRTMLIIAVPVLIITVFLNIYAGQNQRQLIRSSRLSSLSAYQTELEQTLELADSYLENVISANLDFQSIIYAKSKSDAFAASEMVAKTLKPLLHANGILGGFYTYSGEFDYYRAINLASYPHQDGMVIRQAVLQAAASGAPVTPWQTVSLSGRTVLLSTAVFRNTAISVVVDPGRINLAGLEDGGFVFPILPDGTLFAPHSQLQKILMTDGQVPDKFQDLTGRGYEAVSLPIAGIDGHILYAVPESTAVHRLTFMQNVMIVMTVCLLSAVPIYYLAFRRLFLEPLHDLTGTMHAIQAGQTDIHMPQTARIREVNTIAGTVNTMLDTLRQQKIAVYEQQLETQQAQLQYLQLQIRPHFYLNCLNMVYSLAEERDYPAIQELVLNLSVYLRSMFRDSTRLVPLQGELKAAENYVQIQKMGGQPEPQLKLEADPEILGENIPPLSILTFVENSFKHSSLADVPLEIRIKCSKIQSKEGSWLNITLWNNSGALTPEQLKDLNGPAWEMYRENHVGIFNVKQRLKLMYGDRAMLSFRNQAEGICVELFLPMDLPGEEEKT